MNIDPAKMTRKAAHDLLAAAVMPRPIAFVSTLGENGIFNLAPFSFFAVISVDPPLVGFSIGSRRGGALKDTLLNIKFTQDFVINVVTEELAEKMILTSGTFPAEVDEFQAAGLNAGKSEAVRSPRLIESPVNLECRVQQILVFGEAPSLNHFVIGQVVIAHIHDDVWANGGVDFAKMRVIGRLGGDAYCRTRDIFEMKQP